jgi:CubicO group peptidase (beta-lactamase class C family)
MNRLLLLTALACTSPEPDIGPDADTDTDTDTDSDTDVDPPEDITELVQGVYDVSDVPALSGAIVDGERTRALGVAGVRVSGGDDAVQTDELWHLGSETKAMTAALFATYVRDGELSFDDTMVDLFPDLTIDPGFQDVTPRMLLAHRGGAPSAVYSAQWSDWWSGGDVETLRAEWAEVLLGGAPPETVGDYTYSNGGYVIVGAAMEAHGGASWETLISQRLFEPLGMDGCGFGPVPDGWAVGHDSDGTPRPGADNPPALGPAGTVHCDLESWGRFISANLAGPRGESELLSAELWNELHEPQGDYALGWGVTTRSWAGDGPVLTHAGSNTMWLAVAWLGLDIDRGFISITNTTAGDAATAVDTVVVEMIGHDAQ